MEANKNVNFYDIFGLNKNQLAILFNIEYLLVQKDIQQTSEIAKKETKRAWIKEFSSSLSPICGYIGSNFNLSKAVEEEVNVNPHSNLWRYLIACEGALFAPYYPISDKNNEINKKYIKLKFMDSKSYLKDILVYNKIIESGDMVDRFVKAFKDELDRLSGKWVKLGLSACLALLFTAITAGMFAIFAGPIAVAIAGSSFAGLSGAALTSACLAMLGGGAIAIGGAGMAGGVLAVAGGGALLGLAGGLASGITSYAFLSTPEYTLSQAAKIEVVVKEILCNSQKDIASAQNVIEGLKKSILQMKNVIATKELELDKNNKDIDNMKKSLNILIKAYEDLKKFLSSFETGLATI